MARESSIFRTLFYALATLKTVKQFNFKIAFFTPNKNKKQRKVEK
jgi:hypothetical protein